MAQHYIWVLLGAAAGAVVAMQGPINARLALTVGGPLQAALVSFGVGFIALLALNLALRHSVPPASELAATPWWIWIGGLLGAVMVTLAVIAIPHIGVAAWVGAVIAGQLTAAVVYDHFGLFGQAAREATPLRLLGVALMGLGVYLIRRF